MPTFALWVNGISVDQLEMVTVEAESLTDAIVQAEADTHKTVVLGSRVPS